MLEQIPFLQNCEDEDSDEDDELDSVQHKKQRVRVSLPPVSWPLPWGFPAPDSALSYPATCGPAGRLSALTQSGCLPSASLPHPKLNGFFPVFLAFCPRVLKKV